MRRRFHVLLLQILLVANSANARILNPHAVSDPLIDSLASHLDAAGIDVRRQAAAKEIPSERPILTRLKNYPAMSPLDQIRDFTRTQDWSIEFRAGANRTQAIAGVQTNERLLISGSEASFRRLWKQSINAKKVFVSYTSADASYAAFVKDALRTQGFEVFTYLEGPGTAPKNSLYGVGEIFSSADEHLVIDTGAARRSAGIRAEALLLAPDMRPASALRPPILGLEQPPLGGEDEETCCEECTMVNGAPTGCTFLGCGAICAGAKPRGLMPLR